MYSISFAFIPHETISSKDLVFGNDFDRPIRDRLPTGFQTAFKIVKWAVDPGLDGDVMADKPYLYGSALGSWNVVRVGTEGKKNGDKWEVPAMEDAEDDEEEKTCIEEGGDGDGIELREKLGCPDTSAARQKWALRDDGGKAFWEWQKGRIYRADFFNPYLDFNEFALKLPGFSLSILPLMDRHGDGALDGEQLRYVAIGTLSSDTAQILCFIYCPFVVERKSATTELWSPGFALYIERAAFPFNRELPLNLCLFANRRNHDLRYVLKHKDSEEVFFVVVFTMVRSEDAEKEEADAGKKPDTGATDNTEFQPGDDDLD